MPGPTMVSLTMPDANVSTVAVTAVSARPFVLFDTVPLIATMSPTWNPSATNDPEDRVAVLPAAANVTVGVPTIVFVVKKESNASAAVSDCVVPFSEALGCVPKLAPTLGAVPVGSERPDEVPPVLAELSHGAPA